MLCFHKQLYVPKEFKGAVKHFKTYAELDGSQVNKLAVLKVLMNEQGCICPFCERRITFPNSVGNIRPATIDHFFPQSRFPERQLSYFNLIAVCTVCNGKKTDHLIPAYVRDKMFCVFSAQNLFTKEGRGRHGVYHNHIDSGSYIQVTSYFRAFEKGRNAEPYDALLQNTIDLLNLNQFKEDRKLVWGELVHLTHRWNISKLTQKWQYWRNGSIVEIQMNDGSTFPCLKHQTYLSLKMDFLKTKIQKEGIQTLTNFQACLDTGFSACQCEQL